MNFHLGRQACQLRQLIQPAKFRLHSSTLFIRKQCSNWTAKSLDSKFNPRLLVFSRLYTQPIRKQSSGRLPFDIDKNVAVDTLIFSCHNDKFFRMISIFGIIQFIFWGQLAVFAYSSFKEVEKQQASNILDADSFWGKVLGFQAKYKNKIAFLCAGLGYVVLFFAYIYPQRSVHKLVLRKGGQMVDLITYTHLGRTRTLNIPLENINFPHSRTSPGVQTAFKVKGHMLHFLMDKRKGKFHETELFDYVVGLNRKI